MFPQIFGKYVLEREIAEGGMARVFLATLRGAGGFEKRLVVKQIRSEFASDEGFVRRFVAEAKTAVELSHPNIVPVYELGVEQGVYFIAMELCEGATLAELLKETGPLSPVEGAYVGAEVCRALDFAHRRAGVIHRDITPRNVMIDEEGAVRIIDFGIAAPASQRGGKTGRAEVFGSPGHMPPEQVEGGNLTPASDVFAVATALTEAWTGKPPFRRATAAESKLALNGPTPAITEQVPELAPLGKVIAAALSREPGERPAGAEQLARPLREFISGHDQQDIARALGERVAKVRKRLQAPQKSTARGSRQAADVSESGPPSALSQSGSVRTRTFALSSQAELWTRQVGSGGGEATDSDVGASEPRFAPSSHDSQRTRRLSPLPGDSGADLAAPRNVGVPDSRARWAKWMWVVAVGVVATLWAMRGGLESGKEPNAAVRSEPPAQEAFVTAAPAAPITSKASAAPSAHAPSGAADRPPPLATTVRGAPPARHVGRSDANSTTHDASSRAASSASASSSAVAPGRAVLVLTSVPASSVTVGGKALTTPVQGLELAPGSHRITFRNQTWEGPVSTQLFLAAGERKRVHADFTTDPPRVIVR